MDEEKVLVIIKGEDKTKEIEYLSENNNKKFAEQQRMCQLPQFL